MVYVPQDARLEHSYFLFYLRNVWAMMLAVLLMKYFFDRYGFTSSGAIAALVQGLLAKELWKRGLPKQLAGAFSGFLNCHKNRL